MQLVDNMILGPGGSGAVLWTTNDALVAFNTFKGSRGLIMHNFGTGMRIDDNIFLGDTTDTSLYSEDCTSAGEIAELKNNLFLDPSAPLGYGGASSPCTSFASFTNLDAMASELTTRCTPTTPGACSVFGGTVVSGNVTLRKICGTELGCVLDPACSTATQANACIASVIAGWDAASNGFQTLTSTGWLLQTNDLCVVTQGGLDVGVTDDWSGASRTSPMSMGAAEFDGTCN
jgi:hypothetical protein